MSASLGWLGSGVFSAVSGEVRSSLLLAAGVLAVLRDFQVVNVTLPQPARQVPRTIFEKGISVASLQFGFEMGTGFMTYITSTLPYVLVVSIVVSGPPLFFAALAGLGFASGRAIVPLLRLGSSRGDSWDLVVPCREKFVVRACAIVTFGLILVILSHWAYRVGVPAG